MTTTPGDHDQTIAIHPKGVHFLVCVHGMWGLPDHLQRVEETIQAKFADTDKDTELITLRARTNADSHTYDGLDWGAERVVKEVYEMVAGIEQDGLKKVTKFSIFGYSLGGLISRYAIGILYQRGFFRTIKPVNFTTFATPHIGLPRYRGFLGSVMHKLGPVMLSRTGRQFYGTDKDIWSPDDKEGRPLIEVMADPELIFFKALKSFPNITFYGNAIHDLTVVYCTSLAEPYDPFAALKTKSHRLAIKMDPEYKHVIQYFGEVPEGEVVPLSEIDQEDKDRKAALPWYSPSRYRSSRPLRPPFRKLPLPLDILITIAFPFLIPIGLAYAVVRFQRESRASERRLKDLTESPESESSLGTVLRKMEMAMTDMVNPDESDDISRRQSADWQSDLEEGTVVVEDETRKRKPGRAGTPEAGVEGGLPTPALTPSTAPTPDPISMSARWPAPTPKPDDPNQPMLTPAQLAMIESLNSLPQLKKVRAYFPFVRNAHSVIIVRDPKMFAEHELGQGVVNHWADRFVL